MPIIDESGRTMPGACTVSACLPEIDLGCTSGPICCDEPKDCNPICMPIRARDAIKLSDFEISRWLHLRDKSNCDIEYHWRRIALTINGTGSCAKTFCCFAPSGVNKDGELLVNWPKEFAEAAPGYYFLQVHVEGHQPTVFLLYKPWVGVRIHSSRASATEMCDPCPTLATDCMPSCATTAQVIQDEHYPIQRDCGGCDDSC